MFKGLTMIVWTLYFRDFHVASNVFWFFLWVLSQKLLHAQILAIICPHMFCVVVLPWMVLLFYRTQHFVLLFLYVLHCFTFRIFSLHLYVFSTLYSTSHCKYYPRTPIWGVHMFLALHLSCFFILCNCWCWQLSDISSAIFFPSLFFGPWNIPLKVFGFICFSVPAKNICWSHYKSSKLITCALCLCCTVISQYWSQFSPWTTEHLPLYYGNEEIGGVL